jgi:predicted dehydrogenase
MLTTFTPTKTLRVGYIGLGDHAFENLLPAILLTPGLELTIISSRTPEKLVEFGNRFKPKMVTTDWHEVIDKNLVDLVVVSASPQLHYEVAKECLIAGIHCFIEKPPTQNLAQLQELIKLKENTNLKTFVGYNFTFSDAYQKLSKALNNSPVTLAKFRFIVGKLNSPTDGFNTVLESCLYKMFIHPMHTLTKNFGKFETLELFEQVFEDNKFSMQVYFTFESGAKAVLDWGNYSNRFECKFELTNQIGETGVLDNLGNYELWGLKNYSYDKTIFKSKERLVFDTSPLLGGFERTGYQRKWNYSETLFLVIPNQSASWKIVWKSIELSRR